MLEDFGVAKAGESHVQRLIALNNFLIERRRAGQNTVLVLDESAEPESRGPRADPAPLELRDRRRRSCCRFFSSASQSCWTSWIVPSCASSSSASVCAAASCPWPPRRRGSTSAPGFASRERATSGSSPMRRSPASPSTPAGSLASSIRSATTACSSATPTRSGGSIAGSSTRPSEYLEDGEQRPRTRRRRAFIPGAGGWVRWGLPAAGARCWVGSGADDRAPRVHCGRSSIFPPPRCPGSRTLRAASSGNEQVLPGARAGGPGSRPPARRSAPEPVASGSALLPPSRTCHSQWTNLPGLAAGLSRCGGRSSGQPGRPGYLRGGAIPGSPSHHRAAPKTHDLRVVAVSSPGVGDGKSTTAINLAGALAQAQDARVLLVDADLRRPAVAGCSRSAARMAPGWLTSILDPGLTRSALPGRGRLSISSVIRPGILRQARTRCSSRRASVSSSRKRAATTTTSWWTRHRSAPSRTAGSSPSGWTASCSSWRRIRRHAGWSRRR